MLRSCLWQSFVIILIMFLSAVTSFAANELRAEDEWPRSFTSEGSLVTIHEPQIDSWDGFNLKAHAVVAVKKGRQEQVYGVVIFSAQTIVDKSERMVKIEELQVSEANFPSIAEKPPGFLTIVERAVMKKVRNIALDRLEAVMAISDDQGETVTIPVKNPVPKIIFAQRPSVLIYIDGEPRYAPLPDSDAKLTRIVNTRVFLVRDSSGKHYLRLYDGYMEAPALEGPWRVAANAPPQLKRALSTASKLDKFDLLNGQMDEETDSFPSLSEISPDIYTATQPTELFITDGEPNLAPVEGTQLLYVTNSSGSIFKYLKDNTTYLLISGRWFRAGSLEGPWEFVLPGKLPADFARIPDESPKENVKASVPGTPQAREALIANRIPQTAKIARDNSRFIPLEFDGEAKLAFIEGTRMEYVVNCATPVIKVDDQSWYALENGVWYAASALDGPWGIADSVPSVIYMIPPSSPLHYVTYVKIYKAAPQYVYVGYTPGYFGTVVSDNVVVYGTGYRYTPWIGSIWYGPPVTYGLGSSIAWTPWAGWGFSFGFGVGWGWGGSWYYPAAPWWGPYYYRGASHGHYPWGPGGWGYTTGNLYHHGYPPHAGYRSYRSKGAYGNAYNSRNGTIAAGQRGTVRNVFKGERARGGRSNVSAPASAGRRGQISSAREGKRVFGTREGRVYKSSRNGNWEAVNPAGRKSSGEQINRRDFSREERARQTGEQRYRSFREIPVQEGYRTSPEGQGSRREGGFTRGGQGTGRGGGNSRGGGSPAGGGGSYRGEGNRR